MNYDKSTSYGQTQSRRFNHRQVTAYPDTRTSGDKRYEWYYNGSNCDAFCKRCFGSSTRKCYLFSGYSGFPTNDLHRLLQEANVEPCGTGVLVPNTHYSKVPKYVRFLYVECLSDSTGYDKQTYSIKADIMNILETCSKRDLVRKSFLHQRMKDSCFITDTHDLFDFDYKEGTYIIRPCGMIFCSGKDIMIVSSAEEFIEARKYYTKLVESYSKHRTRSLRDVKVIISEYITSPMLFEERKFHLRLYLLVVPQTGNVPFKCKIARHIGKILTAKSPYVCEDFSNKEIHDTHVDSTPRPLFFPNDFPQPDMLPYLDNQLDQLETELSKLAKSSVPFHEQAKAAYEVFGIDLMVLQTGQIKLIEINDRVGYWSDNSQDNTQKFTLDHSQWQWEEAINPLLNATSQ